MLFSAGVIAATAAPALAQNNPFLPPSGGLSKAQIEEIVRKEIVKSGPSTPGLPGAPGATGPGGVQGQMKGVGNLPTQQGGAPNANVASNMPQGPAPEDVVSKLLTDGGNFVGCVGSTPVFKDKAGRRAYFTSQELRDSNEARRYARCN